MVLDSKEILLLQRIKEDESYSNWFFRQARDLKWFFPLKEQGYFNPETISYQPQGYTLFWNVLDYLERVSEQAAQDPQYGKELIEIIDGLVKFSIKRREEKGQGINNYHIWWFCVKILNNFPPVIIKDNLTVDMFRIWLSVWADHSTGSDLAFSDIGEKLLPKFLRDEFGPQYTYAESIIDVVTVIRAAGKPQAFTERDDAVMAWDSYWIRDAFKKHGPLIGQKCSLAVVFVIADRLRLALEYKQKDHYADLEIGNDVYRISVERIAAEGLKPGEIKFKDGQYKCFVGQFSQDQLKNIDREHDFWALHKVEPQIEIKRFSFSVLTKKSFIAEIKKNLPNAINWQNADKFEKKLLGLHEGLYSDYSHIWYRSLKSGPEHGDGAEDILTVVLKDVLIAKSEVNRQAGRQILEAFLNDNKYQFPIFRRFVLLCADKFWVDYFDLLDKIIEVVPTILAESDLEVEMQDVLRNHNSDPNFSTTLKVRLKALIDDVPEYYVEKGDEKYSAYWKFKWLSPLRDNPDFSVLYDEAKQKAEPKDGKPYEPERSAFKGGFVRHKSPISKEDILQKPIAEIVKFLTDFKGTDFWHGTFEGEPDKEGLKDVFQQAVKEQPERFINELELFKIKGLYCYVNSILWGLRDELKAGAQLSWRKIFDFCLAYLKLPSFLDDAILDQGEDSGKFKGKYLWVVDSISDLIEDGARDDKRFFDKNYFDKIEEIFDQMFLLVQGEKYPDTQREALTYAMNTSLGKVVESYVIFSFRVFKDQGKQENWGNLRYERFFEKGIEACIWFGCYLPQIKCLDEEYTKGKIEYFSQKDVSDFEWQMFMEGYLTGARVYRDLYGLMRPNYLKAIESTVFKGRTDDRLVEHICIAYLQLGEALSQNNENGQPSLFWKMLNEADTPDTRSRWSEVAGFFWSISGRRLKKEENDEEQEKPSEDIKKKVLAFWEWTVAEQGFVKSKLGDDYFSFLSRMAELTIWLDRIDDATEKRLMLSAPFIETEHRSAFFVEYLTKFDDEESVRRIGKIFLKVLDRSTPTFRQEDIQLIVDRLYKIGEKDPTVKADADNICHTYGRRGVHFLKPEFKN